MITLIKGIIYLFKTIFQLILIVINCYFIILKYLFVFVNDVVKIELDKRKEVLKNESESYKKTSNG
jgi:hypothetical protein